MSKLVDERRVILTDVRLSYANLFVAKATPDGKDAKYSTAILIPKDDEESLEVIEAAVKNAVEAKWQGKKRPAKLKLPLRDGDEERPDDPVYAGHMFLNANSKLAPKVVAAYRGADGKPLPLGPEDVYSGCYANVSLQFFGFDTQGNRGVGVGLGNVQKTKDGERLGGQSDPEDEFEFSDEADDAILF